MLKRLKTAAQCAIQNVRRSFTFHFNGKHKLDLSYIKANPETCHEIKCDCGETFHYVPISDVDNAGAIVDNNSNVWRYYHYKRD
jgi:hypothetical protein